MQYEREFPEDEAGGKLLDFCSQDCEEQIEAIFGDGEDTGRFNNCITNWSKCGVISSIFPCTYEVINSPRPYSQFFK